MSSECQPTQRRVKHRASKETRKKGRVSFRLLGYFIGSANKKAAGKVSFSAALDSGAENSLTI